MKVIISSNSGYCSGVKRAIKTLDNAINEYGSKGNIFTLGDIIHNPEVIQNYKKKGIFPIEDISKLKTGDNVVIRSHGVSPAVIRELKDKGVNVLDATCLFVLKVHGLAKDLNNRGYFIVLIGEKNHPEVIGIKGNISGENYKIVNCVNEAEKINSQKKIAIISQTTQTKENFILISKKIVEKIKDEVLVINTTCKAAQLRQNETAELAGKVDVMLIIGGKNSANTTYLAEISKNILHETYHIENAGDLNKEWFNGKKTAGICSGASTPQEDVNDIRRIIESI